MFQNIQEVAQGGFTLVTTGLTSDDVLPIGSPVKVDEAARTATLSKTATVFEATSTTTIKVSKGHQLKVGDNVAKTVGGAAYAITAIDTANASYDVLTVGTALGSLNAGDVLFDSSAAGASAAAIRNMPSGLLHAPVKVGAAEGVSVVTRGTVYERRIPGLIQAMKDAMKGILFSQSY